MHDHAMVMLNIFGPVTVICDTAQSLVLSNSSVVSIFSVTNKEHIMTHNVLWYMIGHNKYLGGDRDAFSHISLLKLEDLLIERSGFFFSKLLQVAV